jgi:hypothetical protein
VSAIIEMFRDTSLPRGRNRFSCSLPTWELLAELGRTFGWHPQGTTYVVTVSDRATVPALRNYQPSGSQDTKRIEAEDAMGWARALELAKGSPHFPAMIAARSVALADSDKPVDDLPSGVLEEFIEFAYGGAFQFAISGESATVA